VVDDGKGGLLMRVPLDFLVAWQAVASRRRCVQRGSDFPGGIVGLHGSRRAALPRSSPWGS